MQLSPGARLGPYELQALLGAGGMGEVYRARDTRLGRTVAIKVCRERFSDRFQREARAIASLNHPNICTLYDVGPDYLVMEYIEGKPLRGPLSVPAVLRYGAQICDALEAAHRQGVTHRDLKPANILATSTGVKLLDFGLAKMQAEPIAVDAEAETLTEPLTGSGVIVGTPHYMAPEQVEGKQVDARTDIFALGCVFYELISGKKAFGGASAAHVLASILKEDPAPLKEFSATLPPALEGVVKRCLAKDPEARWQNVRDLKHVLEDIREQEPAIQPVARRNRLRSILWAAAWLAAGVAVTLIWLPARKSISAYRLTPFVTEAGAEDSPAWSPDGKTLAYVADTDREQLQVIVLKTMRERVIARLDGSITPLGWSADSSRIAVAIERGTNVDIAWVSVERGSVRLITRVVDAFQNGRSFSAVLSPDSKQIAFTRFTDGRDRDIFTIREDGTQEKGVVEHPADDYPIGYTNDMRQLLFASNRSGSIDLWSAPVSASGNGPSIPTRIRRDLGVVKPIGITNGHTLYYVLSQCSADVFTVGVSSTYDATLASKKAMATRFVGYNSGPDWSPSGEEIVYQVGQPGSPDGIDLVFLSLRTREERLVHPALLQFSRPRYAADGKSVVVHGVALDGVQGIYQIDRQTGASLLLARGDGEELANPVWTASVEILFFERGGNSVWMLDRNSGKQVQLYKSAALNANFNSAPSSDGKTAAIVDGASLLVVRTGERNREILRLTPPEIFNPFPGSLAWTADGRYILFGKVVERERQVWRIPAGGGRAEPIGLSVQDEALYFLRTSADGRGIAFVIGDCDLRPQEVWSMENFFADIR